MEVHFTADTQKQLQDLAARTGLGAEDIVESVVTSYFGDALQIRETLDSRYDDLKSGKVKPISGDEVEAYFRAKSADSKRSQPGS